VPGKMSPPSGRRSRSEAHSGLPSERRSAPRGHGDGCTISSAPMSLIAPEASTSGVMEKASRLARTFKSGHTIVHTLPRWSPLSSPLARWPSPWEAKSHSMKLADRHMNRWHHDGAHPSRVPVPFLAILSSCILHSDIQVCYG
jgi:hypothetical protein